MSREFTGNERFEIKRRLGEGGMGVVYEAFDRVRGHAVALKMLRDPDAVALLRFKEEFRALADLSHENLVALHELFAEDGRWFFALELVRGRPFYAAIRGERPLRSEVDGDAVTLEIEPARRAYDADLLRDRLRQLARGL